MKIQKHTMNTTPISHTTWYAEAPSGAPDWGIRFVFTFLFPKS